MFYIPFILQSNNLNAKIIYTGNYDYTLSIPTEIGFVFFLSQKTRVSWTNKQLFFSQNLIFFENNAS